ncbi:MAG TPA: alcohol dehydrogenase catalytic domain-containing protein [Galbitalea sp.]
MRALVISAPGVAAVEDVAPPVAGTGEVVVDVERVGVCGTDVEFYTGEMPYLHNGISSYPVRLGHEWCGRVSAVGEGVPNSWIGTRTTGNTQIGCGHCYLCLHGRQHACENRSEVGLRGHYPGALAEQLVVPVSSLHALPDHVDATAGAMVEPGANSLRAAWGAAIVPGTPVLVFGAGTIGLLAAQFAVAQGAEVTVADRSQRALRFAESLGGFAVHDAEQLPAVPYDAIIDAANDPLLPARAVDLVQPGGRVVFIGLAGSPSMLDTRSMVFKDVTAVAILSGSPAIASAVEQYASGAVDPRPLVAATIGLDDVPALLAGNRPAGAGPGPKMHIDPRI